MAILDIAIMVLMATSAFIVYRSLVSEKFKLKAWRLGNGEVEIEGVKGRVYVLTLEGEEGLSESRVSRLAEVIRGFGDATGVLVTYIPVDKGDLLRRLEEDLRSLEFKYSTTRLPRYQAKLEFLRSIYKTLARLHTPVASTLHVLAISDSKEKVETLKRIIEAELGVQARISEYKGLAEMLSGVRPTIASPHVPPPPVPHPRGLKVLLGSRRGGGLFTLSWPSDFEAHVGIFGPTGRGKTVLLAGVAAQLNSSENGPYSTIVIDPKGDLARLLSHVADNVVEPGGVRIAGVNRSCFGSPVVPGLAVFNLGSLPERAKGVEASRIAEAIVDYMVSRRPPGRVLLIVDEAWRIGGSEKLLKVVAREGRSRGLHLIYSSQSPDDLPRDMLFNTRTIIVFGGSEASYLEAVAKLGVPEGRLNDVKSLEVGEALVKVGSSRLEVVRVLGFHEYLNRPGGSGAIPGSGGELWVKG
ncbi:MAG: type IV secretory system conjugative DNA transfer family protein [Desulfurococcales archaeon]|nr:type IV secretory system conjugative DNA transfer family protein [Desulfurococcales archaeon]